MNIDELNALLPSIERIARQAGAAILEVYARDFDVMTKDDDSPPVIEKEDSVLIEIQPNGQLMVDGSPKELDEIIVARNRQLHCPFYRRGAGRCGGEPSRRTCHAPSP